MIFNSGSLIVTRLIAAVSGFAFWAIAANRFPTEAIGFAGAAITSMLTVGNFGMLGIGTYLVSEMHRKRVERGTLFSTGFAVAAAAGLILGTLFATLAPLVIGTLAPLRMGLSSLALFAVGTALTTTMLLLEEVLIGLLLGGMTVLRSMFFAVIRLGALLVLLGAQSAPTPIVMLLAWLLGDGLSALVILGIGLLRGQRPQLGRFEFSAIQSGAGTALHHHLLTMALNISGMLVPIVVAAVLSAHDNAMFSVAWINTSLAFAIPFALSSVLYAAGNAEPHAARAKLRQTLLIGAAASALAAAAFWLAAPWVMQRFGDDYVIAATLAIRVIVLAVFPVLIKSLWVTMQRINGRMSRALRLVSAGGLLELGMPIAGGLIYGLNGACIAWLLSQIILAAVYVLPLLRIARVSRAKRQL